MLIKPRSATALVQVTIDDAHCVVSIAWAAVCYDASKIPATDWVC
jgi:hypothetical protein